MLATSRLTLRPFVSGDADALFHILGNPEVMRFSLRGSHKDLARTERWIATGLQHHEAQGYSYYAVERRVEPGIIGTCGLELLGDGRTEIGYRMRPDVWCQGYATEAARECLRHGFEDHDLKRIFAMIEAENRSSIRVAEKLGMQISGSELHRGVSVIVYVADAALRTRP